jgi:hypothetical protein
MEKHISQGPDEHVPLVRKAFMIDLYSQSPFPTINLIDVLSDGLSETEFRSGVDHLLRKSFRQNGRKLDISKRLGAAIINPSEFVAQLDRPQLMQIALLHSDSDIIAAIDETIAQGDLRLQDFEVRVSRVRRWGQASNQPRAEIGALGARFTSSPSSRLVADRMLRLLRSVYYESGIWDAGDLAYAIEAPNSLSDGELLNQAIRDYSISDLFTKLVLPNRRAVGYASKELGLYDYDSLSREQLLEHMRWKIGEPAANGFTDFQRIDDHIIKAVTANDEEHGPTVIRGHSADLFAAVEDVLNRALVFCIWAFTTDHYLSEDGFVYDPLIDPAALSFIESNAPTEEPELRLNATGANTLVPLSAGFARLAKALRGLDEGLHERAEDDIPAECIAFSRPFAFPYTRTFLNLVGSARAEVLTALQATTRLAQNEDVVDVRNWTSHGNRPFPGKDRVSSALNQVLDLRRHLHATGLYPRLYELVRLSRDGLGREELIYESEGKELTVFRPGWAIAPKLPSGQARLLFIPIAKTESSGSLRFSLQPRPGKDPYWDGWPRRWRARTEYSETEHMMDDSDQFSATA